MIGALHVIIAALVFPDTVDLLKVLNNPTASAAYAPLAFAGLIVLAYAMTPLNPLFRGFLDGSFLPRWLHNELREYHLRQARAIRDARNEALTLFQQFAAFNNARQESFRAQRAIGAALTHARHEASVVTAETTLGAIARVADAGSIPTIPSAEAAADAIETALAANNANLMPPHDDAGLSARVDKAQQQLWKLLRDAETEARHAFDMRSLPYLATVAIDNPQATRVGNARVIAETYSQNVYRVDFNFIWPRLLLVLTKTDTTTERIAAAQNQLDFAVLALALVVTLPLVWLPLILVYDGALWLFLAFGLGSPLLIRFFYQLVVESQVAFGEMAKTVIDKYRFKLIEDLHLPLPATLLAERQLWVRLRQAQQTGQAYDLFYQHRKAASS